MFSMAMNTGLWIRAAWQTGLLCWLCAGFMPCLAGQVHVAVAANFVSTFKVISSAFTAQTGHAVIISSGSTGKLYAQIKSGAPFDVFLAADTKTPAKLINEGLGVQGSAFTYAQGQLVLWRAKPGPVNINAAVLKRGEFKHLAVANPRLSPYGVAAMEALQALRVSDRLASKLVTAENLSQVAQFVATGNADLGFVGLAQVFMIAPHQRGSWWVVPTNLYRPILQDAVLLLRGAKQPAALALLSFMQTTHAKALMRAHGYLLF